MLPNQIQIEEKKKMKKNLPFDLIYSILSLLPVKSVGRFRCVCMEWKSLLSDSQFLKNHFYLNTLRSNKSIFSVNFSFFSVEFPKNDKVPIFKTLNFKFPKKPRPCIYGSCNGLLLLVKFFTFKIHELLIFNPITHESRILPPLPGSHTLCAAYSSFGFGYSSYNDDYVVVVIPDFHHPFSPVYVLRMNMWKTAHNFPLGITCDSSVFVNDTIYWSGCPKPDGPRVLYAFDLGSGSGDTFRQLELPMAMSSIFLLHSLGGRLAVFIGHLDSLLLNTKIDTWVMNECGGRQSWNKILENSLSMRGFIKPLFMWNDDQSIAGLSHGRFASFCLKKKILTRLHYAGEGNTLIRDNDLWNFTDSLFSPSGCNATNLLQFS